MKQTTYKENSISLWGAVGMGTGVMFGAAIFAVLGQVAELAGALFPLSYIGGAVIAACSAHAYVKMANAYPSAGGIGMFFVKVYGKGTVTASSALLMAFSMVIAQSLVARTFGTYTLQLFNTGPESWLVPFLGVLLLIFTFLVNLSGNDLIQTFTSIVSLIKIIGIVIFSFAALRATNFSFGGVTGQLPDQYAAGFIASLALSLLSFKGFTTITNSGSEIINPHKNIGRAITISIILLSVIYLFMALAVSASLPIPEIIAARDYSLAEAARPTLGVYGLWFTVGLAILATVTVCIGSVFAVSRMTAMLSEMNLIPHSHFGMDGPVQKHMLVYLLVIGVTLTVFFDLSRIASLGAIYYLVMDIIFQWGILRRLRKKIEAKVSVLYAAIILDVVALSAFLWLKATTDRLIVVLAVLSVILIFVGEQYFLKYYSDRKKSG
ncbi:MAG: APC family permease [Bacillota bacterium]|nr:APC family permease [Bacillota bacterium]MDW7683974.1 APC family permease [Bacillota bacterium]